MILKGSVRGSAKQLANHLLNTNDNDHVEISKISGLMSDDVHGALQEVYALSKATRCKKYLYSLSLSPPPNVDAPNAYFEDAVNQVAQEFKLEKQPYVLIYHEKEGRRHAHCVWSRIKNDGDKFKTVTFSNDRLRLNKIAKGLYQQHGWTKEMPNGFIDKYRRDPRNFTLQQWQQAKRINLKPQQIKSCLQSCWKNSNDKKSFTSALTEQGYFLAKGDKRGFVAIDWYGEVYSLTKMLSVKSKQLTERLGDSKTLQSVDTTKAIIANTQTDIHIRLQKELTQRQKAEAPPLLARKAELIKAQRLERQRLRNNHTKRQQLERDKRQTQYQKGLHGLWQLVTGRYFKKKQRHEAEYKESLIRDIAEKEKLIKAQLAKRQTLQVQLVSTKRRHQHEAMALNADFVKSVKGEVLKKALKNDFTQSTSIDNAAISQGKHKGNNKEKHNKHDVKQPEQKTFGFKELAQKFSKLKQQSNSSQEPEL